MQPKPTDSNGPTRPSSDAPVPARSKAQRTIARVEQALDSNQTTAIAEIIQIIQTLASRAFNISIPELSQLIGRDPTITERVISAANTLGYNPFATPINTISQAIHTIGFEKVRNLAISLMLTQNAGLTRNTPEQREMAALCVCSGLLAQTLSGTRNSLIDSELAFVCASLRNYGKLLMATFMVEDFRAARKRVDGKGEDAAFYEVFGMTPLTLGREILKRTTLPKSITASLRSLTSETQLRPPASAEDESLVVAEFCGQIVSVAFDPEIAPDAFNGALMDVISKYQRSFPVGLETVNQALLEVETQVSQLNSVIGIHDDSSPGTQKLRARAHGEALASGSKPSAAAKQRAEDAEPAPSATPKERERQAERRFKKSIRDIGDQLASSERVDLKSIYETAIRSVRDTLDLDDCLLFLHDDCDPVKMTPRYGCGVLFNKVKNRPLISPRNRDVFTICLSRKEDILIQDSKAGKIGSVVPDWISLAGPVASFIILPTLLNARLFAILVGVSMQRPISPTEGDLRRLRILRGELASLQKLLESNELLVS